MGLRCAVLLPRVLAHPRFVRIESPMSTQHPHYFRIDSPEDLDGEVRAWLEEAYALGSGSADGLGARDRPGPPIQGRGPGD